MKHKHVFHFGIVAGILTGGGAAASNYNEFCGAILLLAGIFLIIFGSGQFRGED